MSRSTLSAGPAGPCQLGTSEGVRPLSHDTPARGGPAEEAVRPETASGRVKQGARDKRLRAAGSRAHPPPVSRYAMSSSPASRSACPPPIGWEGYWRGPAGPAASGAHTRKSALLANDAQTDTRTPEATARPRPRRGGGKGSLLLGSFASLARNESRAWNATYFHQWKLAFSTFGGQAVWSTRLHAL